MKKLILLAALLTAGCLSIEQRIDRHKHGENPYLEPLFYSKYLDPRVALDQQIQYRVDALAANPNNPALHNELGALLVQKGFPKDAIREFRRALFIDEDFYPAWYNLALVQQVRGDRSGAKRSLLRTIDLKPGHAAAHFQLGLMYEQAGRRGAAVDHYARAFEINPHLLDVAVNPRILDTELVDQALLATYANRHKVKSIQFQQTPRNYVAPERPEAPSPQESADEIVPPAAPVTDPGRVPPPPSPTPQ